MTDFKKRYEKRDEPKARYRVRNWAEYDKALVNRGSVWLWFEEESLAKAWEAEHPRNATLEAIAKNGWRTWAKETN